MNESTYAITFFNLFFIFIFLYSLILFAFLLFLYDNKTANTPTIPTKTNNIVPFPPKFGKRGISLFVIVNVYPSSDSSIDVI